MLLFVFFAHLLLVQLEAVNGIKVLFYSLPYESLLFNVTIGTPGQPIAVKINNGAYWESLAVSNGSESGIFDPSRSSSFQQTGPAIDFDNKTIGITGTDKFSVCSKRFA
ncbi:hypothetical protein M3Y99_00515900 [Aphelenchoides fujianensis]|nr:hypothetical protein M3Y99_00515900 [Aphelenchoides fujianensis]